jgi:hypothetical protein
MIAHSLWALVFLTQQPDGRVDAYVIDSNLTLSDCKKYEDRTIREQQTPRGLVRTTMRCEIDKEKK